MTIGMDGRFLAEPSVGIGKYAANLIRSISSCDLHNTYIIFVAQPISNIMFLSDRIKFVVLRAPNRSLWEQGVLPVALKRHHIDLYHCLGELGIPLLGKTVSVLTVLDIIPVLFQEFQSYRPNWVYKRILPRMIQKCQKVITISECSKNDIVNYLGVPADKVEVIYPGVEGFYRPIKDADRILKQLKKIGLDPGSYILYVGGLHPRKNLGALLEAFHGYLSKAKTRQIFLVIVGQTSPYGDEIANQAKALGIQQRVLFTGHVDEEDLLYLYNGAKLFVYPSKYEGFGLPPLEAMACGCPVIVSKTSSLPEVVGEAGVYFNPEDKISLLEAMTQVLEKEALRTDLSERGLRRSSYFSWKKAAEKTLQVYESIAGG